MDSGGRANISMIRVSCRANAVVQPPDVAAASFQSYEHSAHLSFLVFGSAADAITLMFARPPGRSRFRLTLDWIPPGKNFIDIPTYLATEASVLRAVGRFRPTFGTFLTLTRCLLSTQNGECKMRIRAKGSAEAQAAAQSSGLAYNEALTSLLSFFWSYSHHRNAPSPPSHLLASGNSVVPPVPCGGAVAGRPRTAPRTRASRRSSLDQIEHEEDGQGVETPEQHLAARNKYHFFKRSTHSWRVSWSRPSPRPISSFSTRDRRALGVHTGNASRNASPSFLPCSPKMGVPLNPEVQRRSGFLHFQWREEAAADNDRLALGVKGASLRLGAHHVNLFPHTVCAAAGVAPSTFSHRLHCLASGGHNQDAPAVCVFHWRLNAVRGQGEHPLLEHIAWAVRAAIGAPVSCALGVKGASLRLSAHHVNCSRALFARLRESHRLHCLSSGGHNQDAPAVCVFYWRLNAVRGQGEHSLLEHVARAVRAAIGAPVSCVRAPADVAPLRRAGIIYLSRARRYGSKAHLSVCATHDVNSSRAVPAHAVGCGLCPVCSRTACIVVRRVGTVRTPPPFTSAIGVYVRRLMPYEAKARP
ncbi:hypothetical protein B0H14DRAFT_3856705 [Mycena olivaceomarginata]|nr:hypothetical protein B0H14DRAFT_3856705 [Mycena olivaceomarginata]